MYINVYKCIVFLFIGANGLVILNGYLTEVFKLPLWATPPSITKP